MNTDKELYISFLGGNQQSFEELVLRHRSQLTYFLLQYTHNFDNAEDIAQDIFAYIFVNPERYDIKYEFKTFLYTLAKRRAIDYIRKESRNLSVSIHDFEIEDNTSLENEYETNEDIKLLRNCINKLKREYRIIILLTEIDGMSINEASKILEKSPATTKVLAHRARNALKKIMQQERKE